MGAGPDPRHSRMSGEGDSLRELESRLERIESTLEDVRESLAELLSEARRATNVLEQILESLRVGL